MGTYAYKDEDRNESSVIFAKDAQEKHRKVRYYCPNLDCPAELYICSLDGEKEAYFSANSSIKHVDGCWGASKNSKIKLNEYTEELFEFEDACQRTLLNVVFWPLKHVGFRPSKMLVFGP
ncbi:hypothetical protein [Enterococcus devriesei]|uniref:hypothetical protein n=1 Tax=Enterococcus devriesei TaxID=319970 RepID=UPI0036D439B5